MPTSGASGCCVSVANLTRKDAEDFLAIAGPAGVRTETQSFPLDQANAALDALRSGRLSGAGGPGGVGIRNPPEGRA